MEPYFEGRGVTLYLGDSREVLPTLSGVQLTVTSPPYNQPGAWGGGGRVKGKDTTKAWRERVGAMAYPDELPEPEYRAQLAEVAHLIALASTPTAAMFYNHKVRYRNRRPLHPLHIVDTFEDWHLRQEVIWCRPGGVTHQGGMFVAADERIFWMVRDLDDFQAHDRGKGWLTWWQMNPAGSAEHPCPFPPRLPERAMLMTTNRGDLVLDPYAGRGTTLLVAQALGRRAIGIEREEHFCETAARSLQ